METGSREGEYSKIDVNYQAGGMNYFSGKSERRGIYINFTLVERGENFESYSVFGSSSFKILALELSRRSEKRLDEVFQRICPIKESLHQYHLKSDKSGLLRLITGVFQSN
jgi:hypothetical protein